MLVEKQYAKAGTHHPSFSISIRQCLITQKKKRDNDTEFRRGCGVQRRGRGGKWNKNRLSFCVYLFLLFSKCRFHEVADYYFDATNRVKGQQHNSTGK